MAIKGSLPALYAQDDQQQKLLDEITSAFSSLKGALDSRQQLFDPTLLAAAQGFLAPTKSGGFGESLGNVAAAVGPVQEQERRRGMEEAKMRLELAQSELGMRQQATGMQAARNLLKRMGGPQGAPTAPTAPTAPGDPGAASVGAAQPSGTQPSGLRNITAEDIAALGMLPGQRELAKQLLDVMKYDRDRIKVEGGLIVDTSGPEPRVVADLRKPGEQKPYEIMVDGKKKVVPMSDIEYERYLKERDAGRGDEYAKKTFGALILEPWQKVPAGGALQEISIYHPKLRESITFRGSPRDAAQAEILRDSATRSGDYSELDKFLMDKGQISFRQPPAAQGAPIAEAGQRKAPPTAPEAAQEASDVAHLPFAEQMKVIVGRLEKSEVPAQEEVNRISDAGAPAKVTSSNYRLQRIIDLANKDPEAFGLVQRLEKGRLAGLMKAAQQGLTIGPFRLSVPVEEYLRGAELTPDQRTNLRLMAQLLDEEFFARATAYKSVLGPQMSNADAVLMKSPMASPEDQAKAIKYWAMNGIASNLQYKELNDSYGQWLDRTKGRVSPRKFWSEDAQKVIQKHQKYLAELQEKLGPE